MLDIEGVKKRIADYQLRADCLADMMLVNDAALLLREYEGLRLVCDGLIETKNATMGILGFSRGAINECAREVHKALGLPESVNVIDGVRLVIDSRDNAKKERNELLARCDDVIRESMATKAELDELRTRHTRLIDSTDMFVAALVDERFKKDHAAMIAELHTFRTKDIEASKRLRIEINAMPDKTRTVFKRARIDAKVHGVSIMRELIDMVVNVRATASIECDRLRDECRKHLARINVLESESTGLAESLREMVESNKTLESERDDARKLRDEFRIERDSLRMRLKIADGRLANPGPAGKLDSIATNALSPIQMILHCPQCNTRHIDAGEFATKSHHTHACQSCGNVWRPAIAATVGVRFLPGFKDAQTSHVLDPRNEGGGCDVFAKGTTLPANESTGQVVPKVECMVEDATSANVVPDDVLQRAADYANRITGAIKEGIDYRYARNAINGDFKGHEWYDRVREFVKLWRDGQAPDRPTSEGTVRIGIAPFGSTAHLACTCPASSEYDPPCPRHGVIGIGVTPRN